MRRKDVLKKIISGMISICVVASTGVFAADFDWSLDFEAGITWSGGNFSFNKNYNSSLLDLEDGEHNTVLKLQTENKDTGTLGSFSFGNTISERDYVISFEFLALQKNARFVTQWQTTDKKVITCFTVNNNGVAGFIKNGGWGIDPQEGITQYYGGKAYEIGKWHTVDMVVDIDDATRSYYVDGVFLGECTDGTNFGNGVVGSIAILHGKSYVSGPVDPEKQAVYLDNFTVKYTDSDSFEYDVTAKGRELRFDFTETLVSDLADAEIYNCKTGEKVTAVAEQSGKTLKFTSEVEFTDDQYAIKLPDEEIVSVTGNKIQGEYLYFYPVEKSGNYISSAALRDVYGMEYKPLSLLPITQSEIILNTQGDITETEEEILAKVSLKDAEGQECNLSEVKISDGKITLKIDGFLKMSTKYTLTVGELSGSPEYEAVYTTNDETVEGFFEVIPVFEDGSNVESVVSGEVFAKTDIINTTPSAISATVGLAAYENHDGILKMVALNTKDVEAESMKLISLAPGKAEVKLDVPENADVIKTFIWQKGEAFVPVAESVVVGEYDKKAPSVESGVFENIDGTVDLVSDIGGNMVSVTVTSKDGKIVYADQVENTSETKMVFDMAGNTSEEYRVFVSNSDGSFKEYNLAYINAEEFTSENGVASVIDDALELSEKEGSEKISETVGNNYKLFGISEELYHNADMESVGYILYNKLKDEELSMEDIGWKNAAVIVNKIFLIGSVANGKTENVFDYKKELEIVNDANIEWYEKEYVTEDVQKDITKRLSGSYETEAEFYEKLLEAYVLSIVKDSDGEDNLREVLQNFNEEIGISKKGKDKTYRKLMGKDFDSYDELKDEFEDLESAKTTSGGSSGGGSGSGGKSSGSSASITYPVTMAEETKTQAETLRYDIFDDLDGYEWAKQAIVNLAEKRIVTGKSEDKFVPSASVTREEFAAMLVRAFAENATEAKVSFTDANEDAWYNTYLKKAVGAGIVKGYDDGSFGVGENITRQDMVVMLNRTAEFAGIVFEVEASEKFADDNDISDYAKEAVYLFKEAGIVNGISIDEFSPKANASRGQAAKVIFELLNV